MQETGITPLEDAVLEGVVGGNGVNTDTSTTRLSVTRVLRVPIPLKSTTTSRTRTPFGACVDGSAAECERTGGSRRQVGDCKLDGIDRCWRENKQSD
jgi:hypothetical protein